MTRAEMIHRAMEIVWESLQSHLSYTYGKQTRRDRLCVGDQEFHKQCVKEYAEVLYILSELY